MDNLREYFEKNFKRIYKFQHWSGPNLTGKLMWTLEEDNIVMNSGIDNLIDTGLLGVAAEADFFFEVANGSSTFAAADVPASHTGWTENVDYDEAVRQTWTGVRTGQNVTNSASPGVINVTTGSTFGGAALVSSNIKSNNAAGLFFSGVNATEGDQVLGAGGSLSMVYSITGTDDGA